MTIYFERSRNRPCARSAVHTVILLRHTEHRFPRTRSILLIHETSPVLKVLCTLSFYRSSKKRAYAKLCARCHSVNEDSHKVLCTLSFRKTSIRKVLCTLSFFEPSIHKVLCTLCICETRQNSKLRNTISLLDHENMPVHRMTVCTALWPI